jgi:hypothetical protein
LLVHFHRWDDSDDSCFQKKGLKQSCACGQLQRQRIPGVSMEGGKAGGQQAGLTAQENLYAKLRHGQQAGHRDEQRSVLANELAILLCVGGSGQGR